MKTFSKTSPAILLVTLFFSGCSMVGAKSGSLSMIYGVTALLSLLLLIGCIFSLRRNRFWFTMLFSAVLVVNTGYAILSVSSGLPMALWANRISYLGSVFLSPTMLMIVLKLTNTVYAKWFPMSC